MVQTSNIGLIKLKIGYYFLGTSLNKLIVDIFLMVYILNGFIKINVNPHLHTPATTCYSRHAHGRYTGLHVCSIIYAYSLKEYLGGAWKFTTNCS